MKRREEYEKLADVVTSTLHVFSFPVYALLDQGSTLYFVTPLISSKFDLLSQILHETFLVSTLIGDSVKANWVCIEVDGTMESPFIIKLGVLMFKS